MSSGVTSELGPSAGTHPQRWPFYVFFGFPIALRGIYAFGQWLPASVEFIFYTVLMFGTLICIFSRRLKHLPFWLTWSACLVFLQVGVLWPLFSREWPSQQSPMRADYTTFKLSWAVGELAMWGYIGVLWLVLRSRPEIYMRKRRAPKAIAASEGQTGTSDAVLAPAASLGLDPLSLFWMVRHKCPSCGTLIETSDIPGMEVPFNCKSCKNSIWLVHRDTYGFNLLFGIGAFYALWFLGVRNPIILTWTFLLMVCVELSATKYLLPPKVEVHVPWHGVPSSLIVGKG